MSKNNKKLCFGKKPRNLADEIKAKFTALTSTSKLTK
jgi:hypothetical protein